MAPVGRPTTYTKKLAARICDKIAEGVDGSELKTICKKKGMPSEAAVYRWLVKYPEFREMYVRAREIQADVYADEVVSIGNRAMKNIRNMMDKSIVTPEMLAALAEAGGAKAIEAALKMGDALPQWARLELDGAKVLIDGRKWKAAKLSKKYGPKFEAEVSGTGGGPVRIELVAAAAVSPWMQEAMTEEAEDALIDAEPDPTIWPEEDFPQREAV